MNPDDGKIVEYDHEKFLREAPDLKAMSNELSDGLVEKLMPHVEREATERMLAFQATEGRPLIDPAPPSDHLKGFVPPVLLLNGKPLEHKGVTITKTEPAAEGAPSEPSAPSMIVLPSDLQKQRASLNLGIFLGSIVASAIDAAIKQGHRAPQCVHILVDGLAEIPLTTIVRLAKPTGRDGKLARLQRKIIARAKREDAEGRK